MIKTSNKLGIELPPPDKTIYNKTIANVILNGKSLNAFPAG